MSKRSESASTLWSQRLRSDVSFTVFLSAPDDYEGGELVIKGADSETPYRLEAGSWSTPPPPCTGLTFCST